MNDFDRSLILGTARNVTVERIVKEVYAPRVFTMNMGCIVLDENEQEVDDVSVKYTKNMILLRSLTWYTSRHNSSSSSSSGFVDTDGNTFTGYYISGGSPNSYSASILAYAPVVYISADKAMLSRNDYAVPDDAISVSWSKSEDSLADSDGIASVIHAYYTNETDSDITINKVLIVSSIGTSSSSSSGSSRTALLFEELLDNTLTIKSGERFARDYRFRLDC